MPVENVVSGRLLERDITTYARNLIALVVRECLETGYFEKDLQPFSVENQQRITRRLEKIADDFDVTSECRGTRKKEEVQ